MNRFKLLTEEFRKLTDRLKVIRDLPEDGFTDEIKTERDGLLERGEALKKEIDAEKRAIDFESNIGGVVEENIPSVITIPDQPVYRGTDASALGQQLRDIAIVEGNHGSSNEKREAKSRLEQNTRRNISLIEKHNGHVSRQFEERSWKPLFEDRAAGAGMAQGVGQDGGFLLQSETSIDMMTNGFNNSEVLKRCQRRTITGSESLEIIRIRETSRANSSRGGGVTVYTDGELSAMTESKTKLEKIKIAPERLTGLYYASDKLLKNATFLGQEMRNLFMEEFAFKTQDLVIEGNGAGQALGIKNAGCLISIAKETGQAAATILTKNILKMYARFIPGARRPAWFANKDTFTQLYTLSHEIGTGGVLAQLYNPPMVPGGQGSMLGIPVIFIEQAETLGTAGDIYLTDFSQYMVVDYGNVDEASSIHVKFDYGQTAFRFIYYFDGQPLHQSAITPYKGTNTVSPFLNIAVRS